jgi:receptor expression-enhancing protein 5/6
MGLLVLFIVFGIGQSILTNVIGVAYPVFMSFHALESEGADDDKQWLTYWVVFGLFTIIDNFAGILLSLIPFYYVLKVTMLIWMFHPQSQGALFIYNNFILPTIKKYESQIDQLSKKIE